MWAQGPSNHTDWVVHSGPTTEPLTGPESAHDGTNYGYIDATETPGLIGDLKAEFNFTGLADPFIRFHYHAYGDGFGSLTLSASTDNGSTWPSLWTISLPAGSEWQAATVSLSAFAGQSSVWLRFRGVTGATPRGDVAIDAITVEETPVLALSLQPLSIYEASSSTATVTRVDTAGDLTVLLTSSDTSVATIPGSVTIADGSSSATATVSAPENAVIDPTRTTTITATAAGHRDGTVTLTVWDNESTDFGDAPAPYPTTRANNGAQHRLGGPILGLTIDGDSDGQPSVNADGDGPD